MRRIVDYDDSESSSDVDELLASIVRSATDGGRQEPRRVANEHDETETAFRVGDTVEHEHLGLAEVVDVDSDVDSMIGVLPGEQKVRIKYYSCLLYTSPSPRD